MFAYRKRVALSAIVATSAFLLAGCSAGSAAPADDSPIQIWVPYPETFEAGIKAAADACTADGTPVEVTAFDLSYGELDLKVQAEAQAGNVPDLVVEGLNSLIPLGTNDFVADMAPLAAGDDTVNDEIMPALAAGQLDGKQLIVPWGISVPAIFVNTDLFTEADVDPESLTDWASVQDAATKISALGGERFGISFPQQEGWLPLQYLLTAGTELIGSDNQSVFNDDAGDAAIEYFNGLYTSGAAFPGDEKASSEAFASGEVGMFVGSSGYISSYKEATFDWTTVAFPPIKAGGDVRTAAGGAGIAMFAPSERQAAAWEALKCTMAPDVLGTYAVEAAGYMPVRSDMASSLAPGLLDTAPYAAPWEQFGLVGPWLNFPGANGPRALERFNEAWIEAAQHSSDPASIMDAAAADIDGLLK
jgi:multiple sugar transport system substrate-binding protein